MAHVLAATSAVFRDRDLFVHDGTKLRRFRISAPVQFSLVAALLLMLIWASFATAQLMERARSSGAATDVRARLLERRQALIEAALAGKRIDPAMVEAAKSDGPLVKTGPLAGIEQQQFAQAALIARALDVRYKVTAAELEKLGIKPMQAGQKSAVGGPFESIGNPTFKALFTSWKKLDELQNDVIAIPSDKPIRAAVTFTSGFGVRSDPVPRRCRNAPGNRSCRSLRNANLCNGRRDCSSSRVEQRRLWKPGRDRSWQGHQHALWPYVGDSGSRWRSCEPRPADRTDGFDRPLDRQSPSLRGPDRRTAGQSNPIHEVDRLRTCNAEARRYAIDGCGWSWWSRRRSLIALPARHCVPI